MKLEAGQFYGETSQTCSTNGFRFAEQVYSAGAFFAPHSHELSHFCFALEGRYQERIGRKDFERESNSLIFYPPDTNHTEKHLTLGRHFLVEIENKELNRIKEFGVNLNDPLTLKNPSASYLAVKMYKEFTNRDQFSKLVLESIIPELLVVASRQKLNKSERRPPKWLETIKEFLYENYIHPPKLREIAKIGGIHSAHLVKVFRQFENCTIGEYVRKIRIEKARQQIINTDKPLSEIALELGFSDQPHFTRTFKKETGNSPSKFRDLFNSK